jgi:hypothetical protein
MADYMGLLAKKPGVREHFFPAADHLTIRFSGDLKLK